MTFKIEIEEGKYTFINDNGIVSILRHGKEWRNESGDKALLRLLQQVEQYRNEIIKLRGKAHLSCPNCYEDCMSWVSEGKPCGDKW